MAPNVSIDEKKLKESRQKQKKVIEQNSAWLEKVKKNTRLGTTIEQCGHMLMGASIAIVLGSSIVTSGSTQFLYWILLAIMVIITIIMVIEDSKRASMRIIDMFEIGETFGQMKEQSKMLDMIEGEKK